MTGWYDGWREAKRRLADKPDDEFLQNLVSNLHELALADYLEQFVGEHAMYAEEVVVSADDVPEFLAGLDELRAPSLREQNNLRAELILGANKALDKLSLKNWTADNTYGEAIEDIRTVLKYVLAGSPFPDLERFRCPSLKQVGPSVQMVARCVLQLPHDPAPHKAYSSTGGMGSVTWTDEQALNPPKDNDETPIAAAPDRCQSIDPVSGWMQCQYVPHVGGHRYKHVTWGGPQDATELTDAPTKLTVFDERKHKRCTHTYTVVRGGQELDKTRCILDQGHGDAHEDGQGRSWTNPYPEPGLAAGNPDPINRRTDTRPRCKARHPETNAWCTRPEHGDEISHVTPAGRAW